MESITQPSIEEYVEACNYPGRYDPEAVTRALRDYCQALTIKRRVREITRPWWRVDGLMESIIGIARAALDARAALAARAALDARAARVARAALAARDALAALDACAALAALAARDAREIGRAHV